MLVSCKWLQDFVTFNQSPEEIAVILTSLGLEASVVDDRRGWYEGVVIGRVTSVTKHPNADKLQLTTVDIGADEPLPIVCGAKNVAEGILVPVATVGCVLPGDFTIAKRKVRGELSLGMICSEEELKLAESSAGIMILDDEPPVGAPFAHQYEVCDTILEIDLTPNRGDCASMIGIARDLAAALKTDLKKPEAPIAESACDVAGSISVTIDAPDLCPRYAARVIRGGVIKPSPFWMRRRLAACGVRAINNIVDVTNYILMETGNPLHAFDYARIAGAQITVRRATEGEKFTTLDGKERTLTPENLLIADGDRGVALAGVMGGQNSEVTNSTRDILLEAAFFAPSCIRRSAKGLNISSESSYRFERGTDINALTYAQDRAASLMATLGGGVVEKGRVDAYPNHATRKEVTLRIRRINKLLGIDVEKNVVADILSRLEMPTINQDEESLTLLIPPFRFDIEREIDLVEEVARYVGYDVIPTIIPRVAASPGGFGRLLTLRRALRSAFRATGLGEGLRLSFQTADDCDKMLLPEEHPMRQLIAIDNPLSSETTHMRGSLLPGLISAAAGADDMALFEIGVVFGAGAGTEHHEWWRAAGVMTERQNPSLYAGRAPKRDFYHLKGVLEGVMKAIGFGGRVRVAPAKEPWHYPKRQATLLVDGEPIGVFGQAHPDTLEAYGVEQELFVFELTIDRLAALPNITPKHAPFSRFPAVKRDLALLAPEELDAADLVATIRKSGGPWLRQVRLFDLFRSEKIGKATKSLAFSLEFRHDERTLTDNESDATFNAILSAVRQEHGATLRP